ncbi:monocyte to macrophage differentiation factor [Cimex lectularius]|uniref:Monocyte to macrophage differentiation factor n=1 Tax=Cimex lectularius TaxID=79782 RepID=A0A8I6TLJ0_CIMLE|nr:monocyte to macrophage differentiation factor [Cimex lectularius]
MSTLRMALGKYTSLFSPLHNTSLQNLKSINWMNERATSDKAYVPTTVEHIANVITHGVWVLPSAYGSYELLARSSSWSHFWAAVVYGISLFLCFTVSTIFHSVFYCGNNRPLKEILHRGDRAMIYVFIAASYFPWLVLQPLPTDTVPAHLWWIVWVLAFLGITYQQIFHEKYKSLETFFYVLMGLGPSIIVMHYNAMGPGEEALKLGGLLYILGVIFFKSDGKIPCAHAIWHLFVACAAGIHYFAILNHLYS